MSKQVDLFVVQELLSDRDDVWSSPKEMIHADQQNAEWEAERLVFMRTQSGDETAQLTRIIRIVGDVLP